MSSQGPNLCGTAVDDGGGSVPWVNPGNATASDDTRATASLDTFNSDTNILKCTNFGFSIPAGATVDGIEVTVEAREQNTPGTIVDLFAALFQGGSYVGNNQAASGWSPGQTDETHTYGGPTNKWGTTPTPSLMNNSSNGFGFQFTWNSGSNPSAQVDSVKMTVYYTGGDGTKVIVTSTLQLG